MLSAVGQYGPSYKPPNINQLREELLEKERATLNDDLRSNFFTKLHQYGTTVASDGCADACSRPLINAMAINNKGAMFLKAVNTKSETKVCLRQHCSPAACVHDSVLSDLCSSAILDKADAKPSLPGSARKNVLICTARPSRDSYTKLVKMQYA